MALRDDIKSVFQQIKAIPNPEQRLAAITLVHDTAARFLNIESEIANRAAMTNQSLAAGIDDAINRI